MLRGRVPASRRVVPYVVVALAAILVVSLAFVANGIPDREMALNNSGIWVTNDDRGLFGRVNRSAAALDAALSDPKRESGAVNLDVFQDGDTVVAWTRSQSRLFVVDTRDAVGADQSVGVKPLDAVAMGGGVLATISADAGEVRSATYSPAGVDLLALGTDHPASAELKVTPSAGSGVAIAVDGEGRTFAASATGDTVMITPGRGPAYSALGSGWQDLTVSLVDGVGIVADRASGQVVMTNGTKFDFGPTASVVVQQAGDTARAVVATVAGLYALPLAGGQVQTLYELPVAGSAGSPAVPVSLGGVAYGAWAGQPGTVVRVGGKGPESTTYPQDGSILSDPVFRINRGSVVLNDVTNGHVFGVDEQQSMDDWSNVAPQGSGDGEANQPDDSSKPIARADHIWVRPGRLSVLHVLDNDQDPGTGIVAITAVSGPSADAVKISPDGQTLLVATPPDQAADMSVRYTISNRALDSKSADAESSADVTISMRPTSDNTPPSLMGKLGADEATPDYTVASGASFPISPAYAWRDADSDPVAVLTAHVGQRVLPVTGDGVILYTAPVTPGAVTEKLEYSVSDASGVGVDGVVFVGVMGSSELKGVAPRTNPDVIRGAVGEPITFYPLDNDIPGSDPVNRQARLALASPVGSRVGLTVTTDLASGAVTVTAEKPGPYFLDYTATYGSTFASDKCRLDIGEGNPLVAEPDVVVVRGTAPGLVDLLVNDHDAYGSILTVVSATPADPDRLQAGVVGGRWLRVKMNQSTIDPAPAFVSYVVTNGRGEQATGQVEVRQAPAVTNDRVVVVDDYARVRSGDVTMIPVLDNDSSQSGEALVVNDNVPGMDHAGQLKVEDPSLPVGEATKDVGRAFVDGNKIRYEAPVGVATTRHLRIEYQAGLPMGSPVTGYAWVDVIPEPVADPATGDLPADANHAPTPAPVEARVVTGDTVRIPVAVYGQDPDGDSVTVAGLLTAPKFGRVVTVGANFLAYESYPDLGSVGSDSFSFAVQDRFGATGIGTIRVGFSAPADPAPPVSVDDVVTAQPGASVLVYPATNDVLAVGTGGVNVVLEGDPAGVAVDPASGGVTTRAPGADDPAVSVGYHLEAGGVAGVSAHISVRSAPGYLNPPRVYDHVAESVADGVASVDVLANAWDVDGPASALKLVSVAGRPAAPGGPGGPGGAPTPPNGPTFTGGVISVPLTDRNQVVPFVVEDGDGAQSMAVVFVPAKTGGRPYLTSGGAVELERNGSKTIDLNDYIKSPRGNPVYLTMDAAAWVSPSAGLTREVASQSQITLTARNDYVGPAALTVEVRDASDSTDPGALTGVVTIPVQIGAVTPVLWCPDQAIEVAQGGAARQLNIAHLCHVWMPTPDAVAGLRFTGSWASGGDALTLTGRGGAAMPSDVLVVQAGGTAVPGAESGLTVGVEGYPDVTAQLKVKVVAAPKPKISAASVTDVKQGTTVTVPVTITSPMVDGVPTIINVSQTGGPAAKVTHSGLTIQVTPAGGSHGVLTFDVIGSDIADPARTDRQVKTSFSVTVYGVPDAPSAPQPATQLRSQSAVVSFIPGADNGAPITGYELQWSGGSQSCGLNTTCEVPGLSNGVAYRFQVRAINKAGASPWSAAGPGVTPNAIPGSVEGLAVTAPECGAVTLNWDGVAGEGTAPTAFHLTWAGAADPLTISGGARSYKVTGMDNNTQYDFTLIAENEAGLGRQPVTVTGQSSCKPIWRAGAEVKVVAADMGNTAQVQVSWPAADPQGPTPVTYQVTRIGPGGDKVFAPTEATRLGDTGDIIKYDGRVYTYSVVATNATGGAAHTGAALVKSWNAVGTPEPWSGVGGASAVSLTATGVDGQIQVKVNKFPDYNDVSGQVVVRNGSGDVAVLTDTAPKLLNGFTNGRNVELTFQACNTSGACNSAVSATLAQGSFGPLGRPGLFPASPKGSQVCYGLGTNGNGRTATLVLSADRGIGEYARIEVGTSGMSFDGLCKDLGEFDATVTITGQLISSPTDPPRADSPKSTMTLRSAMGTPDGWPAGTLTLVATGVDGVATLTVPSFPAPNGGTLSVQYWIGTGAKTTIPATGSYSLTGLTNGATTTVNVAAYNGTNWGPTTVLTVVTYGPLGKPSLTASPGTGTQVCAQAATPASGTNGRPASLVIKRTDTGSTVWDSGMTNGAIDSGSKCVDAGGYKVSVGFTAQLITQTGLARGDSAVTTASAVSPPPMPAPLSAAMVGAKPTGNNGEAEVRVMSMPGNTDFVRVTGLPQGPANKDMRPGETTTAQGFINGSANILTFTPCNADQCNPDGAVQVLVTTYGPLGETGRFGFGTGFHGTVACATFVGTGNGAPASLVVTSDHGGSVSASGSGTLTPGDLCVDTGGYDIIVTFTATLSDTSGYGRAPATMTAKQSSGNAPPPPPPDPTVSVSKGSIDTNICPTCGILTFFLANFQGTADCSYNQPGVGSFTFSAGNGSWRSSSPHTGGDQAGHWGAGDWSVSCKDTATGKTAGDSGRWP